MLQTLYSPLWSKVFSWPWQSAVKGEKKVIKKFILLTLLKVWFMSQALQLISNVLFSIHCHWLETRCLHRNHDIADVSKGKNFERKKCETLPLKKKNTGREKCPVYCWEMYCQHRWWTQIVQMHVDVNAFTHIYFPLYGSATSMFMSLSPFSAITETGQTK